jgi:hypothetical protein
LQFLFFAVLGLEVRAFELARQVLYHLSHASRSSLQFFTVATTVILPTTISPQLFPLLPITCAMYRNINYHSNQDTFLGGAVMMGF